MFDIIFKRKTIVIDAFTASINAFDLFPIDDANKFLPDWWKDVPANFFAESKSGIGLKRTTIKSCTGFTNLYQNGFIMPLWSDLIIQTQGNQYSYQFADNISDIAFHGIEQLGKEFGHHVHVKIISPWKIREQKGIKFLYSEPTWNEPSDMLIQKTPPGLVEFKFQHTTHVNMFLSKGRRYEWLAGKPMAHIIPLTENKVELKTHLVGPTEIMRVMHTSGFPFFNNGYVQSKKIKQNKCPWKEI